MGLSYYVIPLMTQQQLVGRKWASFQPHIYGFGLMLLSLGMLWAGIAGVPWRTWDINAAGATFSVSYPGADFGLAVMGIGAIISVIGGAIFVAIAVLTLLAGKKQNA